MAHECPVCGNVCFCDGEDEGKDEGEALEAEKTLLIFAGNGSGAIDGGVVTVEPPPDYCDHCGDDDYGADGED